MISSSAPAVSIIMPLYNKTGEVERAINSVLAQTFDDFELIVINDGSTDSGPDKVRAISDRRIRLVEQSNCGVSVARNIGIKAAYADLIAFLDADDEWEKDFLATIIHLKRKYSTCKVFATSYFFCMDNKKRAAIIRGLGRTFTEGMLDYFETAAQSDPLLCSSTVAVNKEALLSINGFPSGIISGEDLLTWARLAAKYDIAYSVEAKASFWAPRSSADRPGRKPQTPDIVGQELVRLLREGDRDRISGLGKYISLWHKMRAHIYIQLGENANGRREIRKAMKYSNNVKICLFYAAALMPDGYADVLLRKMKALYHNITGK